jgi:hypothetical protein
MALGRMGEESEDEGGYDNANEDKDESLLSEQVANRAGEQVGLRDILRQWVNLIAFLIGHGKNQIVG